MPDVLSTDLLLFIAVGFVAQIIDGALGLAFGVLTTTLLLSLGVPPAIASAMVHVTECFTTAASGLSHAYHRNVDWRLVARLAPAGMLGGAIGAYVLSNIDGSVIAPFISLYLIGIGCFILFRAFRPKWPRDVRDWIVPYVGGVGGLLDAMGGGGWGPIVTSTLLGRGHDLKKVIGSTNLTEFAVTTVISATFICARLGGAFRGDRPHHRRRAGRALRRPRPQTPAGEAADDRRLADHHRHGRRPAALGRAAEPSGQPQAAVERARSM